MIFRTDGDLLVPTEHAVGPWDPDQLHAGAPAAAIARAVRAEAPDLRLARLTVELLGPVPLAPLHLTAHIVKPGRSFRIAEASLTAGGREVAKARAMLVRRGDGTAPQTPREPLPVGPAGLERATGWGSGDAGFHRTGMELRVATGRLDAPGPATVWFRVDQPLVDDEPAAPAERAVAAADFSNGVSWIVSWDDWLFVNTDLTVHLHRDPEGEWVAVDGRTTLEADGSGLAASTLHDEHGPIGRALQTLFVAPRR